MLQGVAGAAFLAALAALVVVHPPSSALRRLDARERFRLPAWLTAEVGKRRVSAEEKALAAELPAALEFLAVCLGAGQPMSGAVDTVARVSPAATGQLLREVAAQLALGRAGPEAWGHLRDHPVWGRVAADIARA